MVEPMKRRLRQSGAMLLMLMFLLLIPTLSPQVSAQASYVRIRNKWQNTYLYQSGGVVKYGAPAATDLTSHWEILDFNGAKRIRNRSTGNYMHIENLTGSVQAGVVNDAWMSARWTIAAASAGYNTIRNAWQTSSIIHIENLTGNAQYGNIPTNWDSPQWAFEPVGTTPTATSNSTATRTNTSGVATATRTSTSGVATATRTRTNTSGVATATRTNTTPAGSGNIVPNPGFEIAGAATTDAASWTEGSSHTRASDRFHSGGWALKSTFTGGGTDTRTASISIQPNTTYTLSAWVYKAATTGAACVDMNDLAGELQLCASTTNVWQQLSGSWNSGANTSLVLRLITDATPNGSIWFDDISLAGPGSPATPTRTNTPSGPTSTPTRTNTTGPGSTATATATRTNTTGPSPTPGTGFKVLVFSKTAGFRHDSIPAGISAIQALGSANGFTVSATEDATQFNAANLAQYKVVVFLSTTGDVLDATQQTAFEQYIRAGGSYVGIHAASDSEYAWPWYGNLVGAYFKNHPAVQAAEVQVADLAHPSTAGLPQRWNRTDEWYNFQTNPRGKVHVLATLNEKSYTGGEMSGDHPIAWCQNYDGGRSWYTGGGHGAEHFSEALFRQHLLGGIQWAAGARPGDCNATIDARFQKVTLVSNPANPMELDVAPDGRVFFAERDGAIKIWKPSTNSVVTAGQLSVFNGIEDGLMGIALDPSFATNGYIYLYYSPAGTVAKQHLSRFTVSGDTVTMSSERILLQIPTQRVECCHSGGSLGFDSAGNLYLATGDNTNPFASDGYAPIDERAGREAWDSQRSAGNTNDLRGKILRIKPQADGTYTIPSGNLFTSGGRPEIYTMGSRNPYRLSVDSETSWLYWGEVGPDSDVDNPARGPRGHDEFNQARQPGNYGWPYCIANNKAYIDYNFTTSTSGSAFNCAAPVNNSPNNTGSTTLPAARPAMIWYTYGATPEFPEMGTTGGRTAMAGPVYHYNAGLQSTRKFPAYYDDTLFLYEWSRNWIREVKLDGSGNLLKINPFLSTFTFVRPMDMTFGPDGALYVIEWGTGFGGGNPDAKIVRIDYVTGNQSPSARASGNPTSGSVPLTVQFSSAGTSDPEGDPISYAWDFTSNGSTDSTAANPSFTYSAAGNYTAKLTVTDSKGASGVANVSITVGNAQPVVSISAPPEGSFVGLGQQYNFTASVTDAEDGSTASGSIPCSRVNALPALGHDDHQHDGLPRTGCSGTVTIPTDHTDIENIVFVLTVSYTDNGAPGVGPATGKAVRVLQPKRKQAEFFSTNNGVQVEPTGDTAGGGQNIGFIDNGDWISFKPMNLQNITSVTYRAASAGAGGIIEVHVGSATGPLISTANIPVTGNWQGYTNVTASISNPGGTNELFFVFKNSPTPAGAGALFNLNWIEFVGQGASTTTSVAALSSEPAESSAARASGPEATASSPTSCDHVYYPLQSGRSWTYSVKGWQRGLEQRSEVASSKATSATVQEARGATRRGHQIECIDGAIVMKAGPKLAAQPRNPLAGFRTVEATGPYLLAASKLEAGATWSSTYRLKGQVQVKGRPTRTTATVTQVFTVVGTERVAVAGGLFNAALRVRVKTSILMRFPGSGEADLPLLLEEENWFAPGVGLVKSSIPLSILAQGTTELKAFTR
jgi:cytochrome c